MSKRRHDRKSRLHRRSDRGNGSVLSPQSASLSNVWLHRFALFTAIATVPLLWVGGLVTSTGAGLAVPDWPTTFGYNMFLFPWSQMVGGIFYEHSHRLIGAVVGLLTIILTLWLWIKDPRAWLRWLGVAVLGAVIAQGILGGLRVVLLQHTLAIIHASFAQAFFGLLVCVALFTSQEWTGDPEEFPRKDAGRLRRLCIFTVSFIYLQLVFGAVLRHTGTRLDAHLLFAALVTIHIVYLAVRILRNHADQPRFVYPVVLLSGLLIVQLGLGVGAYIVKLTSLAVTMTAFARVGLTTTHLVVGSLMLATGLVLMLRVHRLLTWPKTQVGGEFVAEQVSV